LTSTSSGSGTVAVLSFVVWNGIFTLPTKGATSAKADQLSEYICSCSRTTSSLIPCGM